MFVVVVPNRIRGEEGKLCCAVLSQPQYSSTGTVLLMSVPFLMSQGLLALRRRRSNPKSYWAPAALRWRIFNADRVFRNSGARLQQESTNSVKTGLLEAYKLKEIWAPFQGDDDSWVPVHLASLTSVLGFCFQTCRH